MSTGTSCGIGITGISQRVSPVKGRGLEPAADWGSLKSPENYLGYERTANFASPGGAVPDTRRAYAAPAQLRLNRWALSGDWTVKQHATALNQAGGRIASRFHARDLHLVMGRVAPAQAVRFRALIDGQAPGASHGIDTDDQGNGHGERPAALSADPATEAHCGATARYRVRAVRRGSIFVHVRLTGRADTPSKMRLSPEHRVNVHRE